MCSVPLPVAEVTPMWAMEARCDAGAGLKLCDGKDTGGSEALAASTRALSAASAICFLSLPTAWV